jgi:hypothetical protein
MMAIWKSTRGDPVAAGLRGVKHFEPWRTVVLFAQCLHYAIIAILALPRISTNNHLRNTGKQTAWPIIQKVIAAQPFQYR